MTVPLRHFQLLLYFCFGLPHIGGVIIQSLWDGSLFERSEERPHGSPESTLPSDTKLPSKSPRASDAATTRMRRSSQSRAMMPSPRASANPCGISRLGRCTRPTTTTTQSWGRGSRWCLAAYFLVYWITVGRITNTMTTANALEDANLLFIGNSYLNSNNLLGMLKSMLEESGAYNTAGSAFEQYVPGGYQFFMHQNDAVTEGSTLNNFLDGDTPWSWVVLQEQSQVGGFWQSGSLSAAVSLDAAIHEASPDGQTIFFMTWGRRNGDPQNPSIYPNFLAMNARLEMGYRQYVSATPGSLFAPVGLAFLYIYEMDQSDGIADPANDASSLFYSLYAADGSHPSRKGSYLAACVLYQTLTGLDPRTVMHAPPVVAQDAAIQELLQNAAFAVVTAETLSTPNPTVAPAKDTPSPPPTTSPTIAPANTPSPPPTTSPTNRTPDDEPSPFPTTLPASEAPASFFLWDFVRWLFETLFCILLQNCG